MQCLACNIILLTSKKVFQVSLSIGFSFIKVIRIVLKTNRVCPCPCCSEGNLYFFLSFISFAEVELPVFCSDF